METCLKESLGKRVGDEANNISEALSQKQPVLLLSKNIKRVEFCYHLSLDSK